MTSASNRDDGGAAFASAYDADGHIQPGMSLRQWYKGQAVAGLCFNGVPKSFIPHIAMQAGEIADALLAEDAERTKAEGSVT